MAYCKLQHSKWRVDAIGENIYIRIWMLTDDRVPFIIDLPPISPNEAREIVKALEHELNE